MAYYDEFDEFEEEEEEVYDAPRNADRVTAYFEDENDKFFAAKYSNPLLESIFEKYNYKSTHFQNPQDIDWFEEKIPQYAGVTTLEEFTMTLISALLAFGSGDNGLEGELKANQDQIVKAFIHIDGTSLEDVDWVRDDYDGLCEGYVFKLEDGKYSAKYRYCHGGW